MDELEVDDLIDKEYLKEEQVASSEINKTITNLKLYSNNIEMLTNLYTGILEDDNVVYIMTRISQNPVFMEHFPEFYEKNENGESVINCQQNSPYHRFGVFKHILYTVEYVGKDSLKYSAYDMKILKWTMLLHDIGKPAVKTINSEGNDSFAGHDEMSLVLAEKILNRFDFTPEDKNLILTLIKYHDKYLNEGDLTYDNLSFLASELGNKKELFSLLIEVKMADNRAKSIDVYNKFMTVVGKYYEFETEYFSNSQETQKDVKTDVIVDDEKPTAVKLGGEYKEGGSDEDITEKLISDLCKEITNGKSLKCYYQPIVDLKKQIVDGYEVFYKIITNEDFSYKQLIRKAKEFDKYDKLQQMLFINALDRFNDVKGKGNLNQYINIDAKSYLKYVNKARIFDMLDKNKVIFEFNNFEMLLNSKIKELAEEIQKRKGVVAIDNFETSNKTIKDIEQIEPKIVKYKLEKMDENTRRILQELAVFCVSNSINLIVFGIDDVEKLKFVMELGIRYVEGSYFGGPTEGLDLRNDEVSQKISESQEDLIV